MPAPELVDLAIGLFVTGWLTGLWWVGHRNRIGGDPAWLREAVAATAAAREQRWATPGPDHDDRPSLDDRPGRDEEVA